MEYKEVHRDLFSVNFKKYTPAHCISSDCKMGAGIAVPMAKKFRLRGMINLGKQTLRHPTCVYHNGVYNLITKGKYYQKPKYEAMRICLLAMKLHAERHGIKHIVMPKIGSGLDRLSWPIVRDMVKEIFEETDIEILICYI
jgi:O-acetyl-ADP-ribose deacetylase (regulator of RNase III)